MIYRYRGFRFPPYNWKLEIAIVILLCLVVVSCNYSPYPSTTKIKYQTESNTTDKTSSDKDTVKSGYAWTVEQTFRWKTPR